MPIRLFERLSLMICSCVVVAAGLCSAAEPLAPAPSGVALPGLDHSDALVKLGVDPGQIMLAELNCTACHRADANIAKQLQSKQGPLLGKIGRRATPQYLRKYLTNPHALKPGSSMPDMFHASVPAMRDQAVDFILHYLVSLGGPVPASSAQASDGVIERGKVLFHQVGCVACHSPFEQPAKMELGEFGEFAPAPAKIKRASIPLPNLASKTTVEQLAAFLMDPHKIRPSGRMPNLRLSTGDASAIATYLLRDQAPDPNDPKIKLSKVKGLQYEYFEGGWKKLPDFDKLKPKKTGIADKINISYAKKRNNIGLRFRGYITIPKDGSYTFFTASDDGSALDINGKRVVNNDGVHGVVEKRGKVNLTKGDHAITVTFFEASGGEELHVRWQGPGIKKQDVPASVLSYYGRAMHPLGDDNFKLDQTKAQRGKLFFAMLGCANCHKMGGGMQDIAPRKPNLKALADLNPKAATGCLSKTPSRRAANYKLSDSQRTTLIKTLTNRAAIGKPLTAKGQIAATMAKLNCYACHERDGIGGPEAGREAYFAILGHAELGDEGRLPPRLTGVGAKLRPKALDGVLAKGESVRPYMATRMPQFGAEEVSHLTALFEKLDDPNPVTATASFDKAQIKIGRRLVGAKGLGCVNCHNVAGRKSLGVPAVDMAFMYSRLKTKWYYRFMTDPISINKNTRMPTFWPKGKSQFKNVLGGDMKKQQEAILAYLSTGRSMPVPEGMVPANGNELVPIETPIIFRTFMTDASPRAITVGYPEQLSVAFDGNVIRLAKAWRGKFFDPSGTWNGRAGGFKGPLGTDVIDMPPGPSFAFLTSGNQPWPKAEKTSRDLGGKFKGYRLDSEFRPIFMYQLKDVMISEQPIPVLETTGSNLIRKFELKASGRPSGLYFVAAIGKSIARGSDGTYTVDGQLKLKFKFDGKMSPQIHDAAGVKQLLVPVSFSNNTASFEVHMSW